jgi:Cell division protein ZapA
MQTMDELIPITAVIGDRSYRIKIQPKDEEVVRRTLKVVNDKIIEFKTMFAGKDMQDYIAMVLVWYATEQNASLANELNEDNLAAKLSLLEKLLDGQAAEK